jgi:seryl-tRNA synthetase
VSAGTPGATGSPLTDRLLSEGLLVPTGVQGLYGRSGAYQDVADGVSRLVGGWAERLGADRYRFPPVLSREVFAHTNYLESFPDLMGSVHVFSGGDREHKELLRRVEAGGDWPALLEPADVVLTSAACHGVYPMCTGRLPAGGRTFDVAATCYRHEPSSHPARLQSFVMHEVVHVGTAARAWDHRERGLAEGLALLGSLGLETTPVPANDPFFGRAGMLLASGQRDEELKIEGVTAIPGTEGTTAVMSANAHRDHFGRPFRIETDDGAVAHSACVAFGIDRIVVALIALHGTVPAAWPRAVRDALGG